jgi:hypothetical protein
MRARRNDANKTALHKLWLAIGGSWLDLVPEKGGEPDALVGWRGTDRLIEIKDPKKKPSARKLRDEQVDWHRTWRGRPVAVVMSFDDLKGLFDE